MAQRTYKPVLVEVDSEIYLVYLGRPGRPRVYRKHGSSERRVIDAPTLHKVAAEMRAGVDRRKAAEAAELRRRQAWRYRILAGLGALWSRVTGWFSRALVLRE